MVPHLSRRILYALAAAAFLSVGVFGGWGAAGMHDRDGGMGPCLLMPGESSLCTMSGPEHLALFQSKFTAVPQRVSAFALLAFIALTFSIAVRWLQLLLSGSEGPRSAAWLRRLHEHLDTALVDPLKRALARGILHPKTF